MKYVVFWMPTIFHKEIADIKKEVINEEDRSGGFFDLSDEPLKGASECPYYAKFQLLGNGNIVIHSKVQWPNISEEFKTTLFLQPNQSKNGFVQYHFDESTIPEKYQKS